MNKFKIGDEVRVLDKSCGDKCTCRGKVSFVSDIRYDFILSCDNDEVFEVVYVLDSASLGGQSYFLEDDLEFADMVHEEKETKETRKQLMEVIGDRKYSLTIKIGGLDTTIKGYILNLNPSGSCYIDTNNGLVIVPSIDIVKCFPIKTK